MAGRKYSRRRVLEGTALGAASLAGCLGGKSSGAEAGSLAGSTPSVFSDLRLDGSDLVVDLGEETEVERVNLIGPDGQLFRQTDVATGVTTARLSIITIEPELGSYEHYTPGTHEVVAIDGEQTHTAEIELQPDLRITDVSQYRDGESPHDYGKLVVTVENTGTGPTWVYDIAYKDSPNFAANDEVGTQPGVSRLDFPTDASELLIPPHDETEYMANDIPLKFPEEKGNSCTFSPVTFTMLVASPTGDALTHRVQATPGGEPTTVGLHGEFVCSEVTVQLWEKDETETLH